MMLPKGVKKFNNEKEIREQAIRDSSPHFQKLIQSTTTEQALISKRVTDVEYDEDYEETIDDIAVEDHFDEIPSKALIFEPQTTFYKAPEVRDYSIDVWNGSPGLQYWGYNNAKHDE